MMKRLALLAAIGVLVGAAQRPSPPNAPFMVSVVQRTGALIPIARFDGSAWKNEWPAGPPNATPNTTQNIPRAWAGGQEFPSNWNLWPFDGGMRTVSASPTAMVDTACGPVWAVRTDFPGVPRGYSEGCPIPIVGVALNTTRPLLLMPRVDGRQIPINSIAASFEELETRSVDENARLATAPGYKSQVGSDIVQMIDRYVAASRLPFYGHPLDAAERRKSHITVKFACRFVVDGVSLTYVEAHREYPSPAALESGTSLSIWRGWLRTTGSSAPTILDPTMSVSDGDPKDEFLRPLGVVVIDHTPYVVAEIDGWEDQWVGIFTVTASSVRLAVRAPTR
jgi:hypothetical protein